MKHGYGSFNHTDGSSYIGQWQNDLEHGYGDYEYTNNVAYCGQYFKGK